MISTQLPCSYVAESPTYYSLIVFWNSSINDSQRFRTLLAGSEDLKCGTLAAKIFCECNSFTFITNAKLPVLVFPVSSRLYTVLFLSNFRLKVELPEALSLMESFDKAFRKSSLNFSTFLR